MACVGFFLLALLVLRIRGMFKSYWLMDNCLTFVSVPYGYRAAAQVSVSFALIKAVKNALWLLTAGLSSNPSKLSNVPINQPCLCSPLDLAIRWPLPTFGNLMKLWFRTNLSPTFFTTIIDLECKSVRNTWIYWSGLCLQLSALSAFLSDICSLICYGWWACHGYLYILTPWHWLRALAYACFSRPRSF